MINTKFENGEYVCGSGQLSYQAVLNDFLNAKKVRVMTYNISKRNYRNELIDALKKLPEGTDVQIITNIPSRMQYYANSPKGQRFKDKYKETFLAYLDRLNPEHFESNPIVGFNFNNHAKIIGTENILYVGSANYSDESAGNIESGVLIRDKDSIEKIYDETFSMYMDESVPYFDDDFNMFRLFVICMEGKFTKWCEKFENDVTFILAETGMRYIRDEIFFDVDDLQQLNSDIDELNRFTILLENTYSESDEQYNSFVESVVGRFEELSLDWLESVTITDSPFYDFLSLSDDDFVDEYLAEDPDAYDEGLNDSVERAMDAARDKREELKEYVEKDILYMHEEFEKIIIILKKVHNESLKYSNKWIIQKVDNT